MAVLAKVKHTAWSGIAWNGVFVSQGHASSSHIRNTTAKSTPKNGRAVTNELQYHSSGLSLSRSFRGSGHSVSALHKFNEIIPNCNAIARFRSHPGWCLANKNGGLRCEWKIPPQTTHTRERISELLADLAAIDVDNTINTPRWAIQLAKLTNLAVCKHHRADVRDEVSNFVTSEPHKGSTPPLGEETIEVKIEVRSLIPVRVEGDIH